ncbi:hypothetical protein ACWGJP_05890 [Microbacterium sp. NPDC055903]
MHGRRRTWLVGGIGLIACGVVGLLRGSVLGASGLGTVLTIVSDLLWMGAILVLAFGLRREGSMVARRTLGLAAAFLVAAWPVIDTLVGLFGWPADIDQVDDWLFWTYLSMLLPLVAGFIAAVEVARARVVPRPWHAAPLWVIAGQTVVWVVPQVIGVASADAYIETAPLFAALHTLGFMAATWGLGILAIMLSRRSGPGVVTVYSGK